MGETLHTASDTIVARATPPGVAALAVVRMSGPQAIEVAARVFEGADLTEAVSHTASVGFLRDEDGHSIDQVVVTVFRAPRSATGEDVVEISSHGGHLLPGRIVRALERAGARPARAGEFTQRAFLNGKIDLAQAESIAELIHADAERAGDISVEHLKGRYSELLTGIREELLQATSLIELELDFSQEDVEFADRKRFEEMLMGARSILEELVGSYRFGRIARQGIRVVIAGRPNAGKSTLLNALLGFERAIVSEQAGTTRDEIEAEVEVDGLRLLFVDTAGIRETEDSIEAEGVRRSLRAASGADAVLYLYDVTEGFHDEDRLILDRTGSDAPMLVLGNKVDLLDEPPEIPLGLDGTEGIPKTDFMISARSITDQPALLDEILGRVIELVLEGAGAEEDHRIVLVERHHAHLRRALDAVDRSLEGFRGGLTGDLLVIDLREALDELGKITGQITNEDVLDQIFSKFCIGK
ncbi:MAG: tRNA uridine-5-carboxymethylaminomethyl(34) synthesis GTPase MnmE [Rhodothermales bacterium]|nr:tRNA uridine-5-carboxymethylaminomethyl(34) synthesis GTPase MnmE [Rhodothermales bacterium]